MIVAEIKLPKIISIDVYNKLLNVLPHLQVQPGKIKQVKGKYQAMKDNEYYYDEVEDADTHYVVKETKEEISSWNIHYRPPEVENMCILKNRKHLVNLEDFLSVVSNLPFTVDHAIVIAEG